MDEFGCDYGCRTVGEGIAKYSIPDDWCAEFEADDCGRPIVCIQVDQARKIPALMDVRLRIVGNADGKVAGCMVLTSRKTIVFRVKFLRDLAKAIANETES